MTTATAKITPEELLRLPDSQSMELVDGELVEKQVSVLSSKTEFRIGYLFERFLEQRPLSEVFPASMGYRCFSDEPNRVRKPDVTLIRVERIKALGIANLGYMPIVPDLAVEVVSTNDTLTEIDLKLNEYRVAGFPLIWVVDPIARVVYVYPNPGKPFMLSEEDDIRCESALPGFVCKVGELFPPAL